MIGNEPDHKEERKMETFELQWIEINKRFELVNKRKEFKSEKARSRFIDKLMEGGNLYRIL